MTRAVIVNGLTRIATNQAEQATCQQSEDKKEGLKKKIVPWKHNFIERKMTFWLYWKNVKLNEKYREWYQSNPPKIPKQYLPKPIPGELQHITEIRNHLATETM